MAAVAVSEPTRVDMFEQLFQRLEQESELRAHQQIDKVLLEEAADRVPSPVSTLRSAKEHRRGSISISRFGQLADTDSQTVSSRPSRSSSIVAPKPAFYQLDRRPSADSFASHLADADPALDIPEEPQVVQQMYTGKQTISKAISRRLSRARDTLPLPSPTSGTTVVIDVAVSESTVEHDASDDDRHSAHGVRSARVYAPALRHQRSTPGLTEKTGWVSKAKDLTTKIRRKSIAVLSPNANAAAAASR